jgi:DNA polymerase-4
VSRFRCLSALPQSVAPEPASHQRRSEFFILNSQFLIHNFGVIVHLDADAFFASVEQAGNPALRGIAMAVGGQTRGIIASASYEARRCGVYTPMPTARARRVCPQLVVVQGEFAKYREFSRRMFALAEQFTPHIERTSIDEGYFDFGTNPHITPRAAAAKLQATIGVELGITVSLGIGSNKLVAQIASKLRKPNALVEVPRGTERDILAPLECHWLPGVGPKLAGRLRELGLRFISDIANAPDALVAQAAGSYAPRLKQFAAGEDDRELVFDRDDAKSYGTQETFDRNVADKAIVLKTITSMADELMSKVRRDRKAIRTITVRLRYADMSDVSHAVSLAFATDLETDVYPLLPRLVRETWNRRAPVRLAGLRFTNVQDNLIQDELPLDADAQRRARQRDAARLLDDFRARDLPLTRAHTLPTTPPTSS